MAVTNQCPKCREDFSPANFLLHRPRCLATAQPAAIDKAHEFKAGGSVILCGVIVNERTCGRGKGAAIHRLVSDTPQPPDGDITVWPPRHLSASEPQAVPPERNKKVEAGQQGGLKRQALLRESKNGTVLCRHCDEPIYRPLDKYWAHVSGLGLKRCTAILEAEPDTRTSTTDALAEALRGISEMYHADTCTQMLIEEPPCTCHVDVARTALARWEGKGKS